VVFGDFDFPDVQQQLGLSVLEADLFADVAPLSVRDDFLAALRSCEVTIDVHEYYVADPARSMGILARVLQTP